jgi:hypothetical protein
VTTHDLAARVAARDWYHTLELAPGVVTPGWFDLRYRPGRIDFPADLHGLRCLDVGTFDGFWAFTMERRGAAEVVALDARSGDGRDLRLRLRRLAAAAPCAIRSARSSASGRSAAAGCSSSTRLTSRSRSPFPAARWPRWTASAARGGGGQTGRGWCAWSRRPGSR